MASKISSCDGGAFKRCIASSIPEEVIFCILLCLPADVLYDVMRHVCRMWYNIIHSPVFISSHLEKSTSGVLFQRFSSSVSGYFLKPTKCDVEVKELAFQFPVAVKASCNGLVLLANNNARDHLYVANPVTKRQLAIPGVDDSICTNYAFVYVDSPRVYKLINYCIAQPVCRILNLGVDKAWRHLDVSRLTSSALVDYLASSLSLGGFVYWAAPTNPFVLSLDVETETFQQIPLPRCFGELQSLTLLAMGTSLSFMLCKELYVWEVWLLMDPKAGKWAKLFDVNLRGHRSFLEGTYNPSPPCLCPVGWFQNGELIVFHIYIPSEHEIVYNVKTGRIHYFELDSSKLLPHQEPVPDCLVPSGLHLGHDYSLELRCECDVKHLVHVNSLLPLNGFLLP